ncbi:helix-turn-helix domain-containing protein [Mycobacteroides abscessus]|uniref:helix-turn-helix domain-containing protein n=1 Tax=Mycobacteroides abscessus TaxID=36809 RepID=UPI000D6BA42B
MKFSKFCWLEAVRCDSTLTPALQRVICHIGATADENGIDAWKANERVMKELGVSPATVKRARRAATKRGLWVVTSPGRASGQGLGYTPHYRLTMPANGCSTAPIKDETAGVNGVPPDPINDLTGSGQTFNRVSTDPLPGLASTPSSVLSSELSSGESRAREEPLDVTAVPESSDALSQDQSLQKTVIYDGQLVEPDDDPEPPYYCEKHRPYGTPDSCPGCKIARLNHEAWEKRQGVNGVAGWLLLAQQLGEEPAPERESRPKCPWCRDTGLVILSDGTPGSLPMWCLHEAGARRPATDEEIADYERRTA